MKFYKEAFLNDLHEDPKFALYEICDLYRKAYGGNIGGHEQSIEAYALIETFLSVHDIPGIEIPILPSERDEQCRIVTNFINSTISILKEYVELNEVQNLLKDYRREFSTHIKNSFVYSFTAGDIDRVQFLLNELRELVSKSEKFEENHRRRLLKRLENLQSELHKSQSDLDHFWGLVGDAGVAIGKFGTDAKPFVDRIKEITDIVWRTQSRAEELPSDSNYPLLSKDQET